MTAWFTVRKHARVVVESLGRWCAILDEDGEWLCDVEPDEIEFHEQRNAVSSFKVTVTVKSVRNSLAHPVVEHLIGRNSGDLDEQGALVPVTAGARFLVIESAGGARVAGRVGFVKVTGESSPSRIEIHGVSLLGELELLPAPTAPQSWLGTRFYEFDRVWSRGDTGIELSAPRQLAGITLVEAVDGSTLQGTAVDVIRRVIRESMRAAFGAVGWEIPDVHPVQVSALSTGRPSPHVLLRPTDGSLLSEVAETATAAGVTIRARLWLPGDEPVVGLRLGLPTVVIDVLQE